LKAPNGKLQSINLLLPTIITKFLNFKSVQDTDFRAKWKKNNQNIWKSEDFILNPNIINNPFDFKRYFANLVDIKSKNEYDMIHGKKSIKYGGIFDLEINGPEFLIKFVGLPHNQARFQISGDQQNRHIIQFILHSLVFQFKHQV